MDESVVAAEIAALRRRWAAKLPERLTAIDRTAARFLADLHDRDLALELRFLLHRLAGSGASFGFPGVSLAARQAEYLVRGALARATPLTSAEQTLLRAHLGELRLAAASDQPARSPDGHQPERIER